MNISSEPHNTYGLSEVVRLLEDYAPQDNIAAVKKAYQFASRVHEGQKRKSNDPFITHPLAVARILAELQQDATTIAAAILHDAIEDAHVTTEEIKNEFGPEISRLVDGVTKLGTISFDTHDQHEAENYRKMFLAMAEDIRVIIIKLADRLHNMRTLEFLPPEKQLEISRETREIFAPLAHRLGIWRMKWELEDIAFRYLEPREYFQISERIALKRREREEYVNSFTREVKEALEKMNIPANIKGRPKHFYSIYKKITEQHLEFNELFDLLGVRIIVPGVKECYAVLGVIHASWKPIPGRFKDYIAMPKPNMYQSLHTAIIGPQGHPIEIQIRTQDMDQTAEYGVAAHWRYKEGATRDLQFESKLSWLRQLIEGQTEAVDARDYMDNLKINLLVGEVFVFTPRGQVFDFPIGATPLDFAYRVHTEVGHFCQGAKISGRMVTLDYHLQNGDIVEILTNKNSHPRLDWLNIAKTSHARSKIKQWFKKQKREENISAGREDLEKELNRNWLDPQKILTFNYLEPLAEKYNVTNLDDLLEAIGQGEISSRNLVHKILETEKASRPAEPEIPRTAQVVRKEETSGIQVGGMDDVLVRLAKCCNPLPGDDVVGLVTKGRGISIHQKSCANAGGVPRERLISVDWKKSETASYPVEIEVQAFDRVGLLKDISAKISETGTNIVNMNVRTDRRGSAIINIVMDVKNIEHLRLVMGEIKNVGDVFEAYRVSPRKK